MTQSRHALRVTSDMAEYLRGMLGFWQPDAALHIQKRGEDIVAICAIMSA